MTDTTPRARLLAGMSIQWEEHKRKAQDAARTAAFHEREADRLWAEMRALSAPSRAPHGAATHVGHPAWRTEPGGA